MGQAQQKDKGLHCRAGRDARHVQQADSGTRGSHCSGELDEFILYFGYARYKPTSYYYYTSNSSFYLSGSRGEDVIAFTYITVCISCSHVAMYVACLISARVKRSWRAA